MEELTERIDLYLTNKLSEKERNTFEEEMKKDAALAKEVRLQQKMMELLEADAWLETKDKVADLNKGKTTSTISFLRMAAVFIGLVVAGYAFINYQYSDTALYTDYATPYPDRITVMGEADVKTKVAMQLYNDGDYKSAAFAFEKLRSAAVPTEELLLYEVIALTESEQATKANGLLNEYAEIINNSSNLKEAFAWQKIMVSLANNEGDEAYRLVGEYLEADFQYQRQKAKDLKKDLESFWR